MSIILPGLEVTTQMYGDAVTDRLVARVATTANGTLATAFADGQSVDGVTLATGDRILIKDQTTATEDGLYIVQAAGAPIRAEDGQAGADFFYKDIFISEGTANGGKAFVQTASPCIIGTNGFTMEVYGDTGLFGTTYTVGNVIIGNGDGSLKDTGALQIMDTNNNELIAFTATGSAVNQFSMTNAATGTDPIFAATGDDTDVGLTLQTKNDAGILLENSQNEQIAIFSHVASAVNELTFSNAITATAPSLAATGDDTNIDLLLVPKGTGSVVVDGGHGGLQYEGATSGTLNLTVPATITSYSLVYPNAQGASGETLVNDGSGNLTWGSPTAASRIVYNFPFQVAADSTTYTTVGYIAWDDSTYGTYANGRLVLEAVVDASRNLDIRLYDSTGAAAVVESTGITSASDGFLTITGFTNPSADARLELQVRKSANGGTNPLIFGAQVEWTTS